MQFTGVRLWFASDQTIAITASGFGSGFFFGYLGGIPFSIGLALADWIFATFKFPMRPVLTGACGFVLGCAAVYQIYDGLWIPLAGVLATILAALCSQLSPDKSAASKLLA